MMGESGPPGTTTLSPRCQWWHEVVDPARASLLPQHYGVWLWECQRNGWCCLQTAR